MGAREITVEKLNYAMLENLWNERNHCKSRRMDGEVGSSVFNRDNCRIFIWLKTIIIAYNYNTPIEKLKLKRYIFKHKIFFIFSLT